MSILARGPKTAIGWLVFGVAGIVVLGGLAYAAEAVDRANPPSDGATAPKGVKDSDERTSDGTSLADYRLVHLLTFKTANEGQGFDMTQTTRYDSGKAKLVALGSGKPPAEGTATVFYSATPTCPSTVYLFPMQFTVRKDGEAWATKQFDYCSGARTAHTIIVEIGHATRGFGDYEVRGTYVDGEVVRCGFLNKCWEYHSHDLVKKFEVDKA